MKLTANATRNIDIWYEIDLTEDEVWEIVKELGIEVESLKDLDLNDLEQIWEHIMWDGNYDIEEDIGDGDEHLYDWGIENE